MQSCSILDIASSILLLLQCGVVSTAKLQISVYSNGVESKKVLVESRENYKEVKIKKKSGNSVSNI